MADTQILNRPNSEQTSGTPAAASSLTRAYVDAGQDPAAVHGDATLARSKGRPIGSMAAMPVTLHVRIPLPSFKLHSLAILRPGSIVNTGWSSSEDLPVTAGDVRLAWAEFAIAAHKRSVRVTRIS
jgi:hypothetical protein